ncbi:hypothetical protein AB1L17_08755 [Brevibacillus sp. 179-C8.2 HS]
MTAFEGELVAGGSITLRFANTGDVMRGKVIAAEPPHILAYTWYREVASESAVRWELSPLKRRLSFGAHPYDSGS